MKFKNSLRSYIIVALNKNLLLKTLSNFYYSSLLIGIALGKRRVSLSTGSDVRLTIFGKNSSFFGYYDFVPLKMGRSSIMRLMTQRRCHQRRPRLTYT